jgi:hypothetical protein
MKQLKKRWEEEKLTSNNTSAAAAVISCGMKEEGEKVKRCPICGCTEHRLIGCGKHWAKHKEGPDGRCMPRSSF